MAKVKQNVSGCFRVEKYAEAYCRISSYLQTMKNKNVNPLVAIEMALNHNIDISNSIGFSSYTAELVLTQSLGTTGEQLPFTSRLKWIDKFI